MKSKGCIAAGSAIPNILSLTWKVSSDISLVLVFEVFSGAECRELSIDRQMPFLYHFYLLRGL